LQVANFTRVRINRLLVIMGALLLFMFTLPDAYAQEDDLFGDVENDSLLFGDDFDFGGDDASFDFGEEDATDDSFNFDEGDEATSSESPEEDFFGDFEEDPAEEAANADTSGLADEWGLDESGGYDKLITRTVDGEEATFEADESDHPLDFSKYVRGTILEDTGFTLSLYSPQYVAEPLKTWYSYLDFSFTTELPWRFTLYPAELSFSVDISSFSFVNSFPSGGTFKGLTIMPIARVETFGFEVEAGAGMYYPTFGALAGFGYSYKFHSLFASAGYRWNWVSNIDPVGTSWWLEPRFTAGVKLW